MSQITRLTTAGMIGAVLALEGNTGGPVGPDILGIIDVVGDGVGITVAGNPGTHTLTISLANQGYFDVTTVDATPTVLFSKVLDVSQAVLVTLSMVAAQSDYSAGLFGFGSGAARRDAINPAVMINDPVINFSEDFGGGPTFTMDVNAEAIRIVVTGVAATTINWQGYVTVQTL